jgi:hypothetical protein
VVNIANPSSPVEAGFYDTPGSAIAVAVSGNHAYVADVDNGLRVVNIANPASPAEVGFYNTPGNASGVAVAGTLAYVADYVYFGIYDCAAAQDLSEDFIPHPSSFNLSSFPNPFNAITTISYDVPQTGRVSLRVFDLLGRDVTVLADGFAQAGSYRVMFDGSGLATGIYFARLDAGAFSQTKKLMLLK